MKDLCTYPQILLPLSLNLVTELNDAVVGIRCGAAFIPSRVQRRVERHIEPALTRHAIAPCFRTHEEIVDRQEGWREAVIEGIGKLSHSLRRSKLHSTGIDLAAEDS